MQLMQLMQLIQGGTKHIFQETTVTKSGKEGFEHSLILESVGQQFFFFSEGPESKYFRLCSPYGLCHNHSTVPFIEEHRRQYVNE